MGLGQTLLTLFAIVLLMTLVVTINRLRIESTQDTIESQLQLEALHFAQSIVEQISSSVSNLAGYKNLYSNYNDREFVQSFDMGQDLFAYTDVDTTETLIFQDVRYKKVTVSVFADPQKDQKKAEYIATFSDIFSSN